MSWTSLLHVLLVGDNHLPTRPHYFLPGRGWSVPPRPACWMDASFHIIAVGQRGLATSSRLQNALRGLQAGLQKAFGGSEGARLFFRTAG